MQQAGAQIRSLNEKPFVLGVANEIESKAMGEKRVLNIYLPAGYNDTTYYPVVYLLDGSADEDFIHVAGIYQFNNFEWVNRAAPSIIVGIGTVDRRRDLTYPTTIEADKKRYPTTGGSEKFMDFLQKELQPYIEKKYRTNNVKTIIGESLGGLFATEVLLKRPSLFTRYIIVSPSLWWDDGSLLKFKTDLLKNADTKNIKVYIGVGKEGLYLGVSPHVGEVDANVLADKIRAVLPNVYFDYLPEENHATVMHEAVMHAVKWLGRE